MGAQIIPSFKSRSVLWAVMTIAASLMILGKLIPVSITSQINIYQTNYHLILSLQFQSSLISGWLDLQANFKDLLVTIIILVFLGHAISKSELLSLFVIKDETFLGPTQESMGLFGGNNMCQPMENMVYHVFHQHSYCVKSPSLMTAS